VSEPDDQELYCRLNEGLALYSAGKYFEAHEVWEYAWKVEVGRSKLALQALIQIAAALYKHQLGVPAGTSKLLAKSLDVIASVRSGCSAWLGIDFVALAEDTQRALAEADLVFRGASTSGTVTPPHLPRVSGPDGILYLHGFASGPSSTKARRFAEALEAGGFALAVPDQNEGGFRSFTLSRALGLARRYVRDRTLVVGSSLGGYLAALLAASDDRVKALVLMAPAFDFAPRLEARYGTVELEAWQRSGSREVEHYALGGKQAIGYALLEDARKHPATPPIRVPTYVLHGSRDDTVPASVSEALRARHPDRVELDLVDDDHLLVGSADRAIAAARAMIVRLGLRPEPAPIAVEEALRAQNGLSG
jgi:pimeloyl-ACP methyl ester carboxylesterase